jgi:hypothetical protein
MSRENSQRVPRKKFRGRYPKFPQPSVDSMNPPAFMIAAVIILALLVTLVATDEATNARS